MTKLARAGSRATERGSDRPALLIAAVALAGVVALSALVGWVGAPHDERFSWELASIFGTALGTTLLAAATGWLAWSTRTEVRATQDLAELTRRQQAASERPVVLLRLVSWSGSPESGVLTIDLQNVGLGPALRVRWSATYVGDPDRPERQPNLQPRTIAAIEPSSVQRVEIPANFSSPHQPGGIREAARAAALRNPTPASSSPSSRPPESPTVERELVTQPACLSRLRAISTVTSTPRFWPAV